MEALQQPEQKIQSPYISKHTETMRRFWQDVKDGKRPRPKVGRHKTKLPEDKSEVQV